MRRMRSLLPQIPEEKQPRRALEAAQTQMHRLSENLQSSTLLSLPHREESSTADVRVQRVQVQE